MIPRDPIAALVLAAGRSSRMRRLKPLLPLGGSTLLAHAVETFLRGGIRDVTVVVGHRGDELRPAVEALGARCVVNAAHTDGMFSSLVAGVRAVADRAQACFVLPADMPAVRSRTVALLARARERTDASVVYPTFGGRRGHPPLLSSRLFPGILSASSVGTLRAVLRQWEDEAREVSVIDEGILVDLDTPEDYARAARTLGDRAVPTVAECEAILVRARTPEGVVRHGRCVAEVARRLAVALEEAGLALDLPLIAAGGLLHDLARLRPDHARVGAVRLVRLGFPLVAPVIARHMDLAFAEGSPLDEAAVVFLADKLVRGDRVVSLGERFERARADARGSDDARRAVRERARTANAVAREAARVLGRTPADLLRIGPNTARESPCP